LAFAPVGRVYWTQRPGYIERNELDAREPLPAWYWTGDTDMACLRDAIGQSLHGRRPSAQARLAMPDALRPALAVR